MDKIEQELVDALTRLDTFASKHNYGSVDLTNAIKAIFNAIGYKENYQSYGNFLKKKEGRYSMDEIGKHMQQMLGLDVPQYLNEWLYDIVWWDQEADYVLSIPLVCESEWGGIGDVKVDFQKLLLARSKYKVMIFNGYNGMIQWCKKQIHKFEYTKNGDRYLFCSWNDKNGFRFELYVVENLEKIRDKIKEETERNKIIRVTYLLGRKKHYETLPYTELENMWNRIPNGINAIEEDEKELFRQIYMRSKEMLAKNKNR